MNFSEALIENICEICRKPADVECLYNESLRFCYKHGI